MNKLEISNINLYKSFKNASYTILTALVNLINNSINIFKQNNELNEKAIILIYWDINNQKIQLIDNTKGFEQNEDLNNLWYSFDNVKSLCSNLISSCFFLGSNVTIESKNGNKAFITNLDLSNINNNYTNISFYENNEILRIFNTGNRITINDLYHYLDLENIHELYNQLSFIFHKIIDQYKVSIIFSIVKNNLFIDPSTKELNIVNNIASVNKLNFKLPEINNLKTILYEGVINYNNQTISFNFKAYQFLINTTFNGISISNNNALIYLNNDNLFKPKWFDENYKYIYVDLDINNLNVDLFNVKVLIDEAILNKIYDVILSKIRDLKLILPKTFTKPLIDSQDIKYSTKHLDNEISLEESQEFLTKMFKQTKNFKSFNDFEIIKDKLHFTYNADDGKKIKINLVKTKTKNKSDLMQLIPINEDNLNQVYEYDLKIDLGHIFFKDFNNDTLLIHQLEYFIVCYALAECITRLDGSDVGQLKYELNKLLWGQNNDF